MEHVLFQYISKNGLRIHHITSSFQNEETEILRPESHYMYEVFLLLSGTAQYTINGKVYPIHPMNMLIVPKETIHSIVFNAGSDCERISLLFSPHLFPKFNDFDIFYYFDHAKEFSYIIPQELVQKFDLSKLMLDCEELCRQPQERIDFDFVVLLMRFINNINQAIESIHNNQNYRIHSISVNLISYKAIKYIDKNISKKFSLEMLARELNLSESHIRQTFRKEMGITITQYVHNKKMQYAYQLLSQGISPQNVALELGYEYYSTFYSHYVKKFSSPPSCYANAQTQTIEAESPPPQEG